MTRTSTAIVLIASLSTAPALGATWTFEQLDRDKNLEVSSLELDSLTIGAIEAWDKDGDGVLAAAEFDAFHRELGLDVVDPFTAWDTTGDARLDEDELTVGLHAVYDANGNDVIEEAEFDTLEMADAGQASDPTNSVTAQAIVEIPEWTYAPLYADGISVDRLIGEDALGPNGEDIGQVENVLIAPDGQVVALVAEVGGLWELGDTHVSIPWDNVDITTDGAVVPVTEDTINDYSLFKDDYLMLQDAETQIQEVEGDGWGEVVTGPRVWRATELIGDNARLVEGGEFKEYGMVNDILVRDGQVAAAVVSPDVAGGYYAYPYYGRGWVAGNPFYDLPYDQADIVELEPFEYERMEMGG